MGVKGLTTFVDANPVLLADHKLCDTRLIIDGLNLLHFLYGHCQVNYTYGGDYDTFAKKIRAFFGTLRTCNITSTVVLDGGYEVDDRKLLTTISRAENCISRAAGSGYVLPILAFAVFIDTLKELAIEHIVCDHEADKQIAALAVKWKCPVLSNDSDFFIFDLPGGFVLQDYMDLTIKKFTDNASEKCDSTKVKNDNTKGKITEKSDSITAKSSRGTDKSDCTTGKKNGSTNKSRSTSERSTEKSDNTSRNIIGSTDKINCDTVKSDRSAETSYLSVQMYHTKNLYKRFQGMDKDKLSLFAVLMGNDFIDTSIFSNFFSKLQSQMKKVKKSSERNNRMYGVLHWLGKSPGIEHAVRYVVSTIKKQSADHNKNIILKAMGEYTDLKTNLQHYLETSPSRSSGGNVSKDQFSELSLGGATMVNQERDGQFSESSVSGATSIEDQDIKRQFSWSLIDGATMAVDQDTGGPALVSYGKNALPGWFTEALRHCKLSVKLLNAVALHQVFLLVQVERMKSASAHSISQHIRQVIYGILFSVDGISSDSGKANKKTCVKEYNRKQKDLVPRLIPPTFTLWSYGQLPHLGDIPSMTRTARQAIVLHTLQVGESYMRELPENLRLLMSIMVFWVKNSRDGAVTKHHLSALLVSVMKLSAIDLLNCTVDEEADDAPSDYKNGEMDESEEFCESEEFSEVQNVQREVGCGEDFSKSEEFSEVQNDGLYSQKEGMERKRSQLYNCAPKREIVEGLKVEKSGGIQPALRVHSLEEEKSGALLSSLASSESLHQVVSLNCASTEIRTASEQLKKYYSPLQGADASILHGFAEWQTCFSAGRNLNELLLLPFSLPSPAQIYNGTFVNNMCVAFRTKPNFTQEILGHSTKLVSLFECLQNHVLRHLPEGTLASKKRKRVNKGRKAPKSSSSPSNFGSRFRGLSVEGNSPSETDDE